MAHESLGGAFDCVLAIIAHPDDAEFWAGGTVAAWTQAGVEVHYLVLTDGDAGGVSKATDRSQIPAIRRTEQHAAAKVLGVTSVQFLGRSEGSLDPRDLDLRLEIVRVIRTIRPQIVLTWSTDRNWDMFRSSHPDHLDTGEAVMRAIYPDAGNRFAFSRLIEDEDLDPWKVPELWLLNSTTPNHYVDVTDTFDLKVEAVRCHRSQIGEGRKIDCFLRRRLEANAEPAGLVDGQLAEAFHVVATS